MIPRGSDENEIVSGGVTTDVCNLSKPQVVGYFEFLAPRRLPSPVQY